jgi:hypothetical protein
MLKFFSDKCADSELLSNLPDDDSTPEAVERYFENLPKCEK